MPSAVKPATCGTRVCLDNNDKLNFVSDSPFIDFESLVSEENLEKMPSAGPSSKRQNVTKTMTKKPKWAKNFTTKLSPVDYESSDNEANDNEANDNSDVKKMDPKSQLPKKIQPFQSELTSSINQAFGQDESLAIQIIVRSVPSAISKHAKLLLEYIRTNVSNLSFDTSNNLIYQDNIVPGASVSVIVSSLCSRTLQVPVIGENYVLLALKNSPNSVKKLIHPIKWRNFLSATTKDTFLSQSGALKIARSKVIKTPIPTKSVISTPKIPLNKPRQIPKNIWYRLSGL
jgi:hypothetical protein